MHKGDLIITNKTRRRVVKSMQVLLEERSKAYFNFSSYILIVSICFELY